MLQYMVALNDWIVVKGELKKVGKEAVVVSY
jgi:hypothetical protein